MTVTLDFKPSRHTDAYRFTTTDREAPEVLALKRQIAAHNKEVRASMRKYGRKFSKLLRVRFMGRGPRKVHAKRYERCLLYTSPSPRDRQKSRMPSSA